MTELLFQFIWQYQYFNLCELTTTEGEKVEVFFPGHHNTDQGPDFYDARINIAGTVWAGRVELHLRSSDWRRHGHDKDTNYQNVILHVVYEYDSFSNDIPVLELRSRVSRIFLNRYGDLMQNLSFIPCDQRIAEISSKLKDEWLEKLLRERLSARHKTISNQLTIAGNDWEEVLWWTLARNFGMRLNADTFENIAQSVPLRIIKKQKWQLQHIEALLFGQAGLLDCTFSEEYPRLLQRDYIFLKKKYSLKKVMLPIVFLRMRPGNFPTIRLAQLAMLLHESTHLFATMIDADEIDEVRQQLGTIASGYWDTHYRFEQQSDYLPKRMGTDFLEAVFINCIIPLTYSYGVYHGSEFLRQKAIRWMLELKPEQNRSVTEFRRLGWKCTDAGMTQGLLQLKSNYCNNRRCLDCDIGKELLGVAKC